MYIGMGQRTYLALFFKLVVDIHRCCPCMALGRQLRLRPPPHNSHVFREASHLPSKGRKRRPQKEGRRGEPFTPGDISAFYWKFAGQRGVVTQRGAGARARGGV